VPAVTFNPSDNITLANCFASISVGNAFVLLEEGARDDVGFHSLGDTTETYQRFFVKRIDPFRKEYYCETETRRRVRDRGQMTSNLPFVFYGTATSTF
jgi:hypothetical protein